MYKSSTHWADALTWLDKVVYSCRTREQVKSCQQLIRNYHWLYEKQIGLSYCFELTRELERKLIDLDFDIIKQKIKK
jgi:hypothetical protein